MELTPRERSPRWSSPSTKRINSKYQPAQLTTHRPRPSSFRGTGPRTHLRAGSRGRPRHGQDPLGLSNAGTKPNHLGSGSPPRRNQTCRHCGHQPMRSKRIKPFVPYPTQIIKDHHSGEPAPGCPDPRAGPSQGCYGSEARPLVNSVGWSATEGKGRT